MANPAIARIMKMTMMMIAMVMLRWTILKVGAPGWVVVGLSLGRQLVIIRARARGDEYIFRRKMQNVIL